MPAKTTKPVQKWGLKFKPGVAESARHRYQPWNLSHLQFKKPSGQKWDKRTYLTLKWLKNHRKMLKLVLLQAEIALDRIIADDIWGWKRTTAEHNLMRQFYKYYKLDTHGKIVMDGVAGRMEHEWDMTDAQKERNKQLAAAENKPHGAFWREALNAAAARAESPPSWMHRDTDDTPAAADSASVHPAK